MATVRNISSWAANSVSLETGDSVRLKPTLLPGAVSDTGHDLRRLRRFPVSTIGQEGWVQMRSVQSDSHQVLDCELPTLLEDSVVRHVAARFGEIGEIEAVFARRRGDTYYFYIVVPDKTDAVLDRTFEAHSRILDELPEVRLDIHVIYRLGRDFDSLGLIGLMDVLRH